MAAGGALRVSVRTRAELTLDAARRPDGEGCCDSREHHVQPWRAEDGDCVVVLAAGIHMGGVGSQRASVIAAGALMPVLRVQHWRGPALMGV